MFGEINQVENNINNIINNPSNSSLKNINTNEVEIEEINENINNINISKPGKMLKENIFKNANTNMLKSRDKERDKGKIFVGGLTYDTTDEILYKYFSKFDKIVDCVVMRDDSGFSRGFGFLTFTHPELLDSVLKKKHIIDGKVVDPKRAIPREEQDKTEKLFVGGIQLDISEEKFKQAFEKYGNVIDATLIIAKETGKSRGFGFITFEDEKGANKAYENQKEIKFNGKSVEVRHAVAKGKESGLHKILLNQINAANMPLRATEMGMGVGMGMGMNYSNRSGVIGPTRNHHTHAYPEQQQHQYPRLGMYSYNYSPLISTSYLGYNTFENGYNAQGAAAASEFRGYGGTEIASYYRGTATTPPPPDVNSRYSLYNGYNVNVFGNNFIPQRIPAPGINSPLSSNNQYIGPSIRNSHGYHPYSR